MKQVSSTEAKNTLNRILADVERTGEEVAITSHGRPIAKIVPIGARPRTFGRFPHLVVPEDFDDPLPGSELAAWDGSDDS